MKKSTSPRARFRIMPSARSPISVAFCLVVFSLSSSFLPVEAQVDETQAPRKVVVAIAARSLDAVPDPSIVGIIELATSIRLERKRLSNFILDDMAALRDTESFLRKAEALGATCLLLAESSIQGGTLRLHLAWYDGASSGLIAELEALGPVDTRMDDLIFRALDDLLELVEKTTPVLPKNNPEADSSGTVGTSEPPKDGSGIPGQTTGDSPALFVSSADGTAAGTESPSPLESPSGPNTAKVAEAPKGLELGFGVGPFLAAGPLENFFRTSGALNGRVTWYFQGRKSSFGLGLQVAGLALFMGGPLQSSMGVMAPLALEFRLGFAGSGLRPAAHLSGGVAFLRLQTELYCEINAILPFAAAGLELMIFIGPRLGLSLDFSFLATFDGKDLIMGLMPTIGLSIPAGRHK